MHQCSSRSAQCIGGLKPARYHTNDNDAGRRVDVIERSVNHLYMARADAFASHLQFWIRLRMVDFGIAELGEHRSEFLEYRQ
ncbi:MAG: hypothetical protein VW891_14075 [Novosphingobium sp.]